MPTPEEKKQQQINALAAQEKDARLQDLLQGEQRAKQQQMKEELNNIGREKRRAKGKDYWEKVGKNADVLMSDGMKGYNDWVSGMNAIVNTLMDLAMAMSLDPIGDSDYAAVGLLKFAAEAGKDLVLKPLASLVPYNKEIGQFAEGVGTLVSNKVGNTRVGSALGLGTRVPDIKFSVNVDDEGHLVSGASKDGIPLSETEQMHFDAGLVAWAKTHGYTNQPDPNNPDKFVLKQTEPLGGVPPTNAIMTTEHFKELSEGRAPNQPPDTGLKSFMEGRYNINMKYEPPQEPSSGMTP
ncbi:hypothetical protein [Legionella tunisiensis]|uniref:hypothetical protein n=1 Tax=Legionella tunisiensis TaxID=1034944 RepID=UPI0003035F50|nr:hypothetical protein [Legionella tunisiensis]